MSKVKLSNFKETAVKKIGASAYAEIAKEAQLITDNVLNMQGQLSGELKTYMDITGKGFNQVQNDLGVSSNKLNSILKGRGNFTLKTISEIGAMFGKKTKIVFE